MKLQGMALAWMRREDWPRWLAIDPLFQPDYNHWLRRMEKAEAQLKAAGTPVIKVMVDPEEFIAWRDANGRRGLMQMDRASFAVWKMMHNESRGERA